VRTVRFEVERCFGAVPGLDALNMSGRAPKNKWGAGFKMTCAQSHEHSTTLMTSSSNRTAIPAWRLRMSMWGVLLG